MSIIKAICGYHQLIPGVNYLHQVDSEEDITNEIPNDKTQITNPKLQSRKFETDLKDWDPVF
jgi:hypothetical protein